MKRFLFRALFPMAVIGLFVNLASAKPKHSHQKSVVQMNKIYLAIRKGHDLKKAVKGLKAVVRTDPTFAPAYYCLGNLYELGQDWKDSIRSFEKYLVYSHDPALTQKVRAELRIVEHNQFLDSQPKGKTNRLYLEALAKAQIYIRAHYWKEAMVEVASAAKLKPAGWESYALGATVFYKAGNKRAGDKMMAAALQKAPPEQKSKINDLLKGLTKS